MFIVSAKFDPKKITCWAGALGVVLIAVILLVSHFKGASSPGAEAVIAATDQERAAYLESLGWETDGVPTQRLTFWLPQAENAA